MRAVLPILVTVAALACSASGAVEELTFEHDTAGVTILDDRVRPGRDTNWGGANVISGAWGQMSPVIVDGMFGGAPARFPRAQRSWTPSFACTPTSIPAVRAIIRRARTP